MDKKRLNETIKKITELIEDLDFEECEYISNMIGCITNVWVVIYWYKDNRLPQVMVFSNLDGAKEFYDNRNADPMFEEYAEIKKYEILISA